MLSFKSTISSENTFYLLQCHFHLALLLHTILSLSTDAACALSLPILFHLHTVRQMMSWKIRNSPTNQWRISSWIANGAHPSFLLSWSDMIILRRRCATNPSEQIYSKILTREDREKKKKIYRFCYSNHVFAALFCYNEALYILLSLESFFPPYYFVYFRIYYDGFDLDSVPVLGWPREKKNQTEWVTDFYHPPIYFSSKIQSSSWLVIFAVEKGVEK